MPKKIVLNENGLSTYNQKRLDAEMKRINMEKRQYETMHSHAKRKVITRFARKLMLTNLHTNYSNDYVEENEEPEEKLVLPLINQNRHDEYNRYSSSSRLDDDDSSSTQSYNQYRHSDDVFHTETPFRLRMDMEREISNISYDGQNVLQPRTVVAKRSENKNTLPEIFNEQKKISERNSKKFLNGLNNDDSGFYYVTNAKGVPMCDGFDNYGALLKTNSNSTQKKFENPGVRKARKSVFRNPFERETPLPSVNLSGKFESEVDATLENDDATRMIKQSLVPSSATLFHQILQDHEKKEEDKICKDTFKAQNIRSLTMRPVDIY